MPLASLSKREFIVLVAGLMMVDALAIDIMLPALPNIGAAFGVLRDKDRSLVVTAFLLGFGGSQIVFGPLSDSYGRRPLIVAGMAAYVATALCAALAPGFAILLLLRCLQGIAAAAVRIGLMASIRDRYVGKAMADILSLVFSIFLLVPVVMPGVGQLILLIGPWQLIFVVMAGVATVFGVWGTLRLGETLAPADRRPLNFRSVGQGFAIVFSTRRAFFYGIAGAFLFGGLMGFILTGPQVFGEQFGWGPFYPIAMTFMGGSAAICSSQVPKVLALLGMRRSAHAGAVVFVGLAFLAAVLSATVGLNAYAYLLILIVFALPLTTGFSSSGALSMEPLGEVAGTASAVFGLISTVGGAFISYVIAQSYDGTVTPIMLGVGVAGLLVFACYAIAEGGRLFGRDPSPPPASAELAGAV
jgi:DHA1 family bicyclomycin/chloramphenicol resistance-like MFS transporter